MLMIIKVNFMLAQNARVQRSSHQSSALHHLQDHFYYTQSTISYGSSESRVSFVFRICRRLVMIKLYIYEWAVNSTRRWQLSLLNPPDGDQCASLPSPNACGSPHRQYNGVNSFMWISTFFLVKSRIPSSKCIHKNDFGLTINHFYFVRNSYFYKTKYIFLAKCTQSHQTINGICAANKK